MKTIFYKEKSIIISDKNDLSDCFIIQSKKFFSLDIRIVKEKEY